MSVFSCLSRAVRKFALFTTGVSTISAFADVTWKDQAGRLQRVSATLLDSVPFGEPPSETMTLEGKTIISFLPKTNPTVGGKSEKVPTSPVHTVPTIQFSTPVLSDENYQSGVQIWGGYLPPGAEKALGLGASLSQYLLGGALVGATNLSFGGVFSSIGTHFTRANLTGAITASNAQDKFEAQSTVFYFSPGYYILEKTVWTSALIGYKIGNSSFEIPSDQTKIVLSDRLEDSAIPLFAQLSIGFRHNSGFNVALGELLVPKRLLMPKILLSYQYTFE